MNHNYVKDDKFNILTINRDKKGVYFVTGETYDGIEAGDTINYVVNEKMDILEVTEVTQRRDSRSFPVGNNLHYECNCKPCSNPSMVQK